MHMKTAVVSMAVGQGHCEENFTQMCRFIEREFDSYKIEKHRKAA